METVPNNEYMIDEKQLEDMEYFISLGSMVTKDTRGTRDIKSRIAMAKTAFNKKTLLPIIHSSSNEGNITIVLLLS
jgi:hypothetical protein